MSNGLKIYALRTGWCALESVDTEIMHLDNWLIVGGGMHSLNALIKIISISVDIGGGGGEGIVFKTFRFWGTKQRLVVYLPNFKGPTTVLA